jgi:hypothetical protein
VFRPFLIENDINPGEIRWWTRNADGKLVFIPYQMFKERGGVLPE